MKKIVVLKVINPFYDKKNNDLRRAPNSEFSCSKSRAIEILKYKIKLVEILSIKNVISDN